MGNALGAGNREKAAQCVHTGVVFPVISGIIIACVAQLIASKLLTILNVPIEIKPMALTYLRIYMVGLPLIFLYDFESAILRSYGDSRTPLTSLAISGTVNIALNFNIGYYISSFRCWCCNSYCDLLWRKHGNIVDSYNATRKFDH